MDNISYKMLELLVYNHVIHTLINVYKQGCH